MIGLGRNREAAGRGHRFEPDGDIHIVPEHLFLVGHHIAHVDAQTELHDPVGGEVVVALGHQRLHGDRSLDGADDAGKLQQKTVAGVLHDPAAVIEDDRVNRGPMGLEVGVRALLVGAHHAGVAGNVSADDGCQTSLHISDAPEWSDNRRNTSLVAGIQWL